MNYNNNQDEISWETSGDELLFRKNKLHFFYTDCLHFVSGKK